MPLSDEAEEMMEAIKELREAFTEHRVAGAEERALIQSAVNQLKQTVEFLHRCVCTGNGQSLIQRVGGLDERMGRVEKTLERLTAVLDEKPKLRIAFWGPIAVCLITSITSVIVALIAVMG